MKVGNLEWEEYPDITFRFVGREPALGRLHIGELKAKKGDKNLMDRLVEKSTELLNETSFGNNEHLNKDIIIVREEYIRVKLI